MKLKDYKDKIKGFPVKKEIVSMGKYICGHLHPSEIADMEHNSIVDYIENLEFNPAELIELDKDKLIDIIHQSQLCKIANKDCNYRETIRERKRELAQAIVDSKDVVKQVELDKDKFIQWHNKQMDGDCDFNNPEWLFQAIVKAFKAGV